MPNFYNDLDEMLLKEKPDFAIIATPHLTHFKIAEKLIKNKIPFLKEKPFAINLQEALALKELIEKNKVYFRLCVQRRFHPLYVYAHKALFHLNGIRHFDAHYQLHANAYYTGWRSTPEESGGGCVMDMGYHYVDLLYWYFGIPEQIFSVAAPKNHDNLSYSIEETTITSFKYRDGLVGNLFLSLCESQKFEELKVYGKSGSIQLQREFLKRFDNDNNLVESLTRTPAWPSAVAEVLHDFIDNFDDFEIVKNECKAGVAVIKMIDAIYSSIKEKKSIIINN
jgi:predicted dehydrogenase